MTLFPDDWSAIFAPGTPQLELLVRGSVLYLGILLLMRLMPRRSGADLATMDLIFALLIAEAAAHALGDYTSVADGLVLIGTLMAWNYTVNFLSYHVPAIERFMAAPPTQVVRGGRILWHNMRRELLTEQELLSHIREAGIEEIRDVRAAYVEGEGRVTAIRNKPDK